VVIVAVVVAVVWPDIPRLPRIMTESTGDMLTDLQIVVFKIIGAVIILMTLIAFIDIIYQRYDHHKKLRMTKQEVKDEFKQTEGDPQIKGRLRQLRQEKARQRMMAAVPESSVVVTNPTHFAVALKYDQATMSAPILVAKGVDLVAKRIRDLARENEIPIVENPPLARALHAGVELDQEVPPEHYQAVAEIIGYVMRLKQGLRPDKFPHRRPEVRDWKL
jgi:flagellar biosynthetic protein FlhB